MLKGKTEYLYLVNLAFFVAIAIIRIVFLVVGKTTLPSPGIIVNGIHIHHFAIGIIILACIAISPLIIPKWEKKHLKLFSIVYGIALALVIDEFSYWLELNNQGSFTINTTATLATGLLLISSVIFSTLKARSKKQLTLNFQHFKLSIPRKPQISVVIPAYNEAYYLRQTLHSLSQQSFKNFETIVVDNNSTDATAEIAKSVGAKVLFETSLGVAFARQRGFEKSNGQIIVSTDADCVYDKNWLKKIKKQFDKDKNLIAYCGIYQFFDGSWLIKLGSKYLIYPLFFFFGWYSGANFAILKKDFKKLGGFDTKLTLSEDSELIRRAKQSGKVFLDSQLSVETSARRFKGGIFVGVLNYLSTYIRLKLSQDKSKIRFAIVRDDSDLPKLKLVSYMSYIALTVIIFLLLFLLVPVNKAHAKINRVQKSLHHKSDFISKFEVKFNVLKGTTTKLK